MNSQPIVHASRWEQILQWEDLGLSHRRFLSLPIKGEKSGTSTAMRWESAWS
jgi:hypothetical protein